MFLLCYLYNLRAMGLAPFGTFLVKYPFSLGCGRTKVGFLLCL